MFSKSRTESANSSGRRTAADAGSLTIIAADVEVRGDIVTTGELHVDGVVKGDLKCGAVVLGQTGRLYGSLAAERATLRGLVEGPLDIGALVIEATAVVTGDIVQDTVRIDAGARVNGQLKQRDAANAPAALPAPGLKAVGKE